MPNPFSKLLRWYFSRNAFPYWVIFLVDSLTIFLSGFFIFWLFNRGYETLARSYRLSNVMVIYMMLSWIGMRVFHTYSGIVRYSSFVDLTRVGYASIVSIVLSLVARYFINLLPGNHFEHLHSYQIIAIFLFATLLMWAVRVTVKTLYEVLTSDKRALRVLIYGNMSGGVSLAKSIRTEVPQRFLLKGFITDDPHDPHDQLMGEHLYGTDERLKNVIEVERIEAVLVSPLSNYEFRHNQALQDMLINADVKIFMMPTPTLAQPAGDSRPAAQAQAQAQAQAPNILETSSLREVSVEDLLPRDEIKVDMMSIGQLLRGKRVLITGSAGSIGSEMVRQVATYAPSAMMLIDQAETPEHDIRLMMSKDFPNIKAETVVTSICKSERMESIFSTFKPDYVLHAAAYKHVPMMEDNPSEAVQNNIYGTKVLADLSVKYGVKKFVMVSTDKAVNPTNVMGCSKRICEIYVQALSKKVQTEGGKTQFVTTRFGNVLGSNGSVIPLFREQIKNGGPVTVTHPDIIRYFMLISEACKLVLEAGTKGNGGEIFVFDMGKPVRIADLAKRMIRLSGAHNVKIEFTGLREGEKLYEEVLSADEDTMSSFHSKIRIAKVREYDFDEVCRQIEELIKISFGYDNMATVKKMKEIVPEYKSNNSVYEKLD